MSMMMPEQQPEKQPKQDTGQTSRSDSDWKSPEALLRDIEAEERREKEEERERKLRVRKKLAAEYLSKFEEYCALHWEDGLKLGHRAAAIVDFKESLDSYDEKAFALFEIMTDSFTETEKNNWKSIRKALKWALFSPLSWVAKGIRKCKITETLVDFSNDVSAKIANSCKFLCSQWSSARTQGNQGIFSIYYDKEKKQTIFHLGRGAVGSFFITYPGELNPEEFAKSMLNGFKWFFKKVFPKESEPILLLNGDHQGINLKRYLPNRVVLRSSSSETSELSNTIDRLYHRAPLNPANTTIIGGIPETPEELGAVGINNPNAWNSWKGLAKKWHGIIKKQGLTIDNTNSLKDQFLTALGRDENVIVIVAHADKQEVQFPKPPPDGESVSMADIESKREEIEQNKPVVYLYCCETADVGQLSNLTSTLLNCGAAAVFAPQTSIEVGRSLKHFKQFLRFGKSTLPILGFKRADNRARYREMEGWIG